jgi:uncharacterized repeat protein (TIGR03803 family)
MRRIALTFLISVLMSSASSAQTFTTLFSFNGTTNSSQPNGPLVQGFDGNFYGTTVGGNTGSGGGYQDRGTVFKITPKGTLTTIYTFCSQAACADGGNPLAGLLLGIDGNFYGTTSFGTNRLHGTIFKITPQGVLTMLYRLCLQGNCKDGINVLSPLIQGTDGDFYGAASAGGVGCNAGCGSIFKLTPSRLIVLHDFCLETGCPDGATPNGVVQATDGNLYGTTRTGGTGEGTLFRITTGGTLTTLYDFCNPSCPGLFEPEGGLIQANSGDLYGTAPYGGPNNESIAGGVFQISLSGAFSTIYDFCAQANCADGIEPMGEVIQATDGNFYGTTTFDGRLGGGTLFKLTSGGNLTVLHNFPGWRKDYPGVMQATDGNFYGTTQDTAKNYYGILFKESTGLAPFVETVPTSGAVGSTVTILGTNLTGTSAVSFNGIAAAFTVVSATEITAAVPTGATTGTVSVKTPTKTLTSNVAFRVP